MILYHYKSGKPYGELYHHEEFMFNNLSDAQFYLEFNKPTIEEIEKLSWLWGPSITEFDTENNPGWPTCWDGNETVPVPIYSMYSEKEE